MVKYVPVEHRQYLEAFARELRRVREAPLAEALPVAMEQACRENLRDTMKACLEQQQLENAKAPARATAKRRQARRNGDVH